MENNKPVFRQENIINLINEAGGEARYDLLCIMDFMSMLDIPKRVTKINQLTHYERMLIDIEKPGYDPLYDTKSIMFITGNKIRVLYLPGLELEGYIIKIINDVKYIIFSKPLSDEYSIQFIGRYTNTLMRSRLLDHGIIQVEDSVHDWIGSFATITIERVELFVVYCMNIFNVVYNMTNHAIADWDYIKTKFDIKYEIEPLRECWEYGICVAKHSPTSEQDIITEKHYKTMKCYMDYLKSL